MVLSGLKIKKKTILDAEGKPVEVAAKAKLVKSKSRLKSGGKKKLKARTVRLQKKKETQLVEDVKSALVLRGNKTSQTINEVLKDLKLLKAPDAKILQKKNDIHAFEDENSLEFLTTKNECPLFLIGSHTKKRPDNLIMGRTYDGHILDMIEFGVDKAVSIAELKGKTKQVGSKPCFIFQGDDWERDETLKKAKNMLLDFFRGTVVSAINLAGLDHVVCCTSANSKILLRCYAIHFKKSGSKVPKVELDLMGPSLDLVVRRTRFAATDLLKEALRKPKGLAPKKVKNITRDELSGDKFGRIHMEKQDLSTMQVKRMKALRASKDKEAQKGSKVAESTAD